MPPIAVFESAGEAVGDVQAQIRVADAHILPKISAALAS